MQGPPVGHTVLVTILDRPNELLQQGENRGSQVMQQNAGQYTSDETPPASSEPCCMNNKGERREELQSMLQAAC